MEILEIVRIVLGSCSEQNDNVTQAAVQVGNTQLKWAKVWQGGPIWQCGPNVQFKISPLMWTPLPSWSWTPLGADITRVFDLLLKNVVFKKLFWPKGFFDISTFFGDFGNFLCRRNVLKQKPKAQNIFICFCSFEWYVFGFGNRSDEGKLKSDVKAVFPDPCLYFSHFNFLLCYSVVPFDLSSRRIKAHVCCFGDIKTCFLINNKTHNASLEAIYMGGAVI